MARRGNGGMLGTAGGLLLGLVALGVVATMPRLAAACTDEGCYESMPAPLVAELKGGKTCYGIFGSGVPFLNPYNDTRANLALLLEDRKLLTLTDRRPPPDAPPKPADGVQPHYPVPFWIVNLRERQPSFDASPTAPAALADLAVRLGLDRKELDAATTRLAADRTERCTAETPATVTEFVGAVATAPGLADGERTVLADERLTMAGRCLAIPEPTPLPAAASSPAQSFAAYLAAARHFYRNELDLADSGFAAIATSPVPWVAEAATYMIGRVHLNQAQLNAWGKYGEFDRSTVDQAKLTAARDDLKHYLAAYPDGRYAASAKGFARRIDWLAGDVGGFVGDVAAAFDADQAQHPDPERVFALLDEIDTKYLSDAKLSPITGDVVPWTMPEIAATAVLTRMRDTKDDKGNSYEPIATEEIEQHKAALSPASDPALGDLIELEHTYFVDHDLAKVIQATDGRTPSPTMGNVPFSFFMLRGLALESQQRRQDGNDLWRSMLTEANDPLRADLLQLALALNDERSGKLAEVFAKDSLVQDPALHRPLLKYAAAPALLRNVVTSPTTSAADKGTALFTLLYKTLQQGDYRGFNEILAKYPPTQYADADGLHLFAWQGQAAPSYACPALAETTHHLAAAGNDPVALNCLGEFFRHFEDKLVTGTKPPDDELGGTPDGFKGPKQTRLDYYLKVIANPKSHGDAEAYALSRAINCFASVGNNHCGEQDIAEPDRKRWFDRLKQTYKDNGWSKRQTYWW